VIVEMIDSTVLVPPGWTLSCDAVGSMHLTRKAQDGPDHP
jgi:hypothetical protein